MAIQKRKNRIDKLKSARKTENLKRPLKGLLILLNEYYWKSLSGPFLGFIFPLILVSIIGWLLGYYSILGGSLTISVFAMTLTSMPIAIYEFKSSSLLKRIGATPIKPWIFILTTSLFYLFMMMISLFWTILMFFMIFAPYVNKNPEISVDFIGKDIPIAYAPSIIRMFNSINWGGFIISELLTTMVAISCGFMLSSIGRSAMFIQISGIIIMITTMMLSGCLFPPYLIRKEGTMSLWWMGYAFTPFKSSINMVIESWYWKTPILIGNEWNYTFFNVNNSTIFNCNFVNGTFKMYPMIFLPGINVGEPQTICDPWEKILDWILPFVWIGIFMSIAISKFKWTTR